MDSVYATDPSGKNVYNRNPNQRPVIKIGNWVEDQAIYDELQRQRRTGEFESAANSIKDYRVDSAEQYSTENRDIGHFGEKYVKINYTLEEKEQFQRVPHYNPESEQSHCNAPLLDERRSHDILNTTLPNYDPEINKMESSMRMEGTGVLDPVPKSQLGKQEVEEFKVKF